MQRQHVWMILAGVLLLVGLGFYQASAQNRVQQEMDLLRQELAKMREQPQSASSPAEGASFESLFKQTLQADLLSKDQTPETQAMIRSALRPLVEGDSKALPELPAAPSARD